MKVLWITNRLMPEAASLLTGKGELRASGGWMIGLSNELRQHSEIDLAIAAISPMVKNLTFLAVASMIVKWICLNNSLIIIPGIPLPEPISRTLLISSKSISL